MPIPFVRTPQPASWSPGESVGPVAGLTLRECHVLWLLSVVPAELRAVLLDWLIAPTDIYRWQPPPDYSSRRAPFAEGDLADKALTDYCDLLGQELQAMRYTLDIPWQVLGGLKRAGLLVTHGIRLRQLAGVMCPAVAAHALRKIIAERPPDPRFAAAYGAGRAG